MFKEVLPMDPNKLYVNYGKDDQMEIEGYCHHKWRKLFTWVLIFLTIGFLRLVFHWFPWLELKFTHVACSLAEAEAVLLKDQYNQRFVEDVQTVTKDGTRVRIIQFSETLAKNTSMALQRLKAPTVFNQRKTKKQIIQRKQKHKDETCKMQLLSDENLIKYFIVKKEKYVWNNQRQEYIKLSGIAENKSCSFLHEVRALRENEVNRRRILYGINSIAIHVTPILVLLFKEALSPFYIFQVFSVILWYCDGYEIYSSSIVFISLVSLIITIYQTREMQRTLRNTIHVSEIVSVCREDDIYMDIPSEDLVPGDLIEIPQYGCTMHCDAVLISGNCIVNESMLTGESIPITKTPIPNPKYFNDGRQEIFDLNSHVQHILFSGTQVIQTRYYESQRVRAVVIRTGFYTAKGELVRSILFPIPMNFVFNQDTYRFVGILGVIALVGFIYTVVLMVFAGENIGHIIQRTLDLITIVIPPALPATLTIGTIFAQHRLKRNNIYCISPSNITLSGSLNVVCFDKTGTLTEDGLDFYGVVPVSGSRFGDMEMHVENLHNKRLITAMATCHSLTIINDKLSGDPLDQIMFVTTGWVLKESGQEETRFDMLVPTIVHPRRSGMDKDKRELCQTIPLDEIGIVRLFTFSSHLRRMSVVTRQLGAKNFEFYSKGSPEMIASLSKPETVPLNFHETLMYYTQHGYRVLGLAWKSLPTKLNYVRVQRISRHAVERDLNFLGLLILENRLKPETTPNIRKLQEVNIKTVMLTGDNMLTALSVARECNMVDCSDRIILVQAHSLEDGTIELEFVYADERDRKVEEVITEDKMNIQIDEDNQRFHFAVTGKSWDIIRVNFPDLLSKLLVRGTVFARMSPSQKTQLIESLRNLGYYVGMCGDGANDCGALKTAHTGISLSEAEASVASSFTSRTPTIECVPTTIREGRAALVTSFGIFKYMACYSLIQFVSVLILYWISANLTDFEFLYIDLFLILPLGVTYSWTEAYPELSVKPPIKSLMSIAPVLSLMLQLAIQIAVQVFSFEWVYRQPWFEPFIDNEEEEYASYENMAVFITSVYQYIILVLVFSKGPPYRKTVFTNFFFIIALVVCTGVTLWITIDPVEGISDLMELKPFPSISYRLLFVGIAGINFFASLLLEMFIIESNFLHEKCEMIIEKLLPRLHYKYATIEQEIANMPEWPPISSSNVMVEAFQRQESIHLAMSDTKENGLALQSDSEEEFSEFTTPSKAQNQASEFYIPSKVKNVNSEYFPLLEVATAAADHNTSSQDYSHISKSSSENCDSEFPQNGISSFCDKTELNGNESFEITKL